MSGATRTGCGAAGVVGVLCLFWQASAGEKLPPSLYKAVRSALLEEGLYRNPTRLVSGVAPSGAVSVNADWERGRGPKWFIEQQRYGGDLVQAAVVRKDRALLGQGWKVLGWGFDRQGKDGGFPGTGDPFHSTSLFVEASARALLLGEQSGWDEAAAPRKRYEAKLASAARWLMRPDVAARGRKNNRPYAHRRWVLAAALGEAAAVTGDRRMAGAAAEYAREGLALQTREGVNPEKGGADVSYQGVGLLMAGRYYTVCADAGLRERVKAHIERGLRWELGRVNARGEVALGASTRTGKERGRSGAPKRPDYKSIVQGLVLGTAITGNPRYQACAQRIARERKWLKGGRP